MFLKVVVTTGVIYLSHDALLFCESGCIYIAFEQESRRTFLALSALCGNETLSYLQPPSAGGTTWYSQGFSVT